jgi:proteasome lid subunit RPN8/RPN11
MLVATKSFITHDGYREVRIISGVTHIAPDHEIVKRAPDCFAPGPNGRRGGRERILATGTASVRPVVPAAPRPDLGREPWRLPPSAPECSLRDRPTSPTHLRLSASAREQLLDLARSTTAVDGREAGGLLIGAPYSRGLIEILQITGPGPRSVRTADSYTPDLEHDLAIHARLRADSSKPVVVVGVFHSHPQGYRVPSSQDLTSVATWRSLLDLERLVSLIVVPARGGWSVDAWTVRGGFDRDICEPARLHCVDRAISYPHCHPTNQAQPPAFDLGGAAT